MIRIDLREIPIFVLNLKKEKQRRAFMAHQLNLLGLKYQFIDAVKCDPGPVGIALSHLKTIRQNNLKPPFLILEDDCKIVRKNFNYIYRLPQATDALYLGHSTFGLRDKETPDGVRWGRHDNVKYKFYDDNYIRVFNMLARHAVIYISEKFVENAIKANLLALLGRAFTIPADIEYAEMQPQHLVLSTREVYFYQNKEYGGIEAATRYSIVSKVPPYEGTNY